jgi:hypothetical protein
MRDVLAASMRQLADQWEAEAGTRRRFTPSDQVADALVVCASELRSELTRVETATRLLTVAQYAAAHTVSESTVRRWCVRGELEAERNGAGEWVIPRASRRMAKVG